MPRKAQIPEHWKEGYEKEDAVYNPVELNPEMVVGDDEIEQIDLIDAEPMDLIEGEGTDRDDLIEMTDKEKQLDLELERQQQKYDKMQKEKETKTRISGKKKQIRHMKYAPAYEAGAKLKVAGSKLKSGIEKKRGSPEQRKQKREKMKTQMKKVAIVAKKKGMAFGKSMQEKQGGKTSTGLMKGGQNLLGTGQKQNLAFGNQRKAPMTRNTGTRLMDKNVNLLGNTGSKLMGSNSLVSSKKKTAQTGSKMMTENILGTATGKNKDKKNRLY